MKKQLLKVYLAVFTYSIKQKSMYGGGKMNTTKKMALSLVSVLGDISL